jgi:phosphoribosylaminoimidazole (AIR) synthetase
MGLGMVAVVAAGEAEEWRARLEAEGEKVYAIGEVVEAGTGAGRVALG